MNIVVSKEKVSFSNKQYVGLAFPLIIAGITTPLIGAVDTAVVGRLPDPSSIGGVAIGAVIFNTMYWLLGFLRVSTSGFTAQAQGSHNINETKLTLLRPIIIAMIFGLLFIIFQKPILHIALNVIGGSDAVSSFASTYFSIRVWGAPFILMSYVFIGWLIGMGKVQLSLATQLIMNLMNIVLSIVFVLVFELGVAGVGYATLISEISAVLFGGFIIAKHNTVGFLSVKLREILDPEPLLKMVKVNRDLFLRTICLLIMTGIFTSKGAGMGEVTLAANAILLQIHYIMAYLIGGFANASSILTGRAVGRKDSFLFNRAVYLSAVWGGGTAVTLAALMWLFGDGVIGLFTSINSVKDMAIANMVWMVIFPFVGFWGLQLEGIFSGATDAKSIRNSIFLALLVFLLVIWLLVPMFENQGIWLAFVIFSLSRSIFLFLYLPKLQRLHFP
ncbi:MATE family efflux transporter [Sutcliffiella horikoshii]|uniref:Probable multidrug resistance protein NorM n=1 Tax=Sutcliffiella horikoshii TaxID=79883 RepID=A0AA94WNI1_9BACI|nr:MATE family efflux transporter [Sutcliffiella horikoshii]TYS55930.1 MATE family efflux transporter [Sutcliffiella horikoshii]